MDTPPSPEDTRFTSSFRGRCPGDGCAVREQTGVLSHHRPGDLTPGGPHRAIELVRDADWQPPERKPWNSRVRLAFAAVVLATATLVHLSGITQPAGLQPTFVLAGRAGSVAVDGGLGYVVQHGTVTAYRLADSAVVWARPLPGAAPTIVPLGDHRLLLSTLDPSDTTSLQVVDATSGAVDWASSTRLIGLAGPVAVVGGGQDAEFVRLAGLDLATGDSAWTATLSVWTTVARPVSALRLREQAELTVDGTLALRDLTTGRIRARTTLPPRTTTTSLSLAGGLVVVETGGGRLLAFDATDLRPVWQRPTPLIGYFSQFVACGEHVCHINDRGTVALDRATGRTLWQAPVRYRARTVDEEHLFVAGFFHRSADSAGGVLDPASGSMVHDLAPWAALETLDVVNEDQLLVWRLDGQKRVVVGLFDAYTGRTHVVGRTDTEFGTPVCAAGDAYVLCTGERDVAGWPT